MYNAAMSPAIWEGGWGAKEFRVSTRNRERLNCGGAQGGAAARARGDIAIYHSPAYVFIIAMPPTTVIPACAGIYACRLHYSSRRLRRWIPACAGMTVNMATRSKLARRQDCHCAGGGATLRLAPAGFPMGWFGWAVFLFRWFGMDTLFRRKTESIATRRFRLSPE